MIRNDHAITTYIFIINFSLCQHKIFMITSN